MKIPNTVLAAIAIKNSYLWAASNSYEAGKRYAIHFILSEQQERDEIAKEIRRLRKQEREILERAA